MADQATGGRRPDWQSSAWEPAWRRPGRASDLRASRPRFGRRAGILAAVLVLAVGLVGVACDTDSQDCLPGLPTVHPRSASPGGMVTVQGSGFDCARSSPPGTVYRLSFSQGTAVDLGSTPVARDGSFSISVRVPAEAAAGPAWIAVTGSPWDTHECDDTFSRESTSWGSASVSDWVLASCPTFGVGLTVTAP